MEKSTGKKFVGITVTFVILFISLSQGLAQQPGKTRMQTYMQKDLEKASDRLFWEAKRYYDQGLYWESARDLIVLLDFHSNYSKIDQVVIFLADCLYEIGLDEGATRLYKHLIQKYIRSPYLPNALLGLQKIEYKRNDFGRSIEFYKAIVRGNPTEETLDASRYYAGLAFYKLKDYPRAIKILSNIDEKSPYYDYGLYSVGLSLLRLKRVRQAIDTFRNVCKLPIISEDRRSVVDEAHLTLGYIYYELGYYKQALGQFRSVSSNHSSYDKALLAAGWAANQMGEYEEAIAPLTTLVSKFPENANMEEGLFLLGRCYLKIGRYDEALVVYDNLIKIFPEQDVIPAIIREVNASLALESEKIDKIKMDLLVLETKLLDTIQLDNDKNVPLSIKKERERIAETREGLLKRIREERETFDNISSQIQNIRYAMNLKENRRDWRAFAEYGKARALFLKRMK